MDKIKAKRLAEMVGRSIARRRTSKGLTQETVAELLDIGTESVSRMERGVTIPTVTRLAELAEIFDCGIDELLTESSIRTDDQAGHIITLMSKLSTIDRVTVLNVVELICSISRTRVRSKQK